MAQKTDEDLCEEPDAEFFDTFFDDGVLETIGQVLGDQKSANDESSCELLERCTESPSPDIIQITENNLPIPQDLIQPHNMQLKSSKNKIIILKPAHINDTFNSLNLPSRKTKFDLNSSTNVSEELVHTKILNGEVVLGDTKLPSPRIPHCEESAATSQPAAKDQNLPKRNDGDKKSSSMDELLAKVQRILKETSGSQLKVNQHSQIKSNTSTMQECEEKDLAKTVKNCVAGAPTCGLKINQISEVNPTDRLNCNKRDSEKDDQVSNQSKNLTKSAVESDCENGHDLIITSNNDNFSDLSKEPTQSATPAVGEKEDRDEVPHILCSPSVPNVSCSETLPKNTHSDTELKASKDDTEKENDLVSEDAFTKKHTLQSPTGKKNKININLKSQILASTTILNSGSSSNPELSSPCSDKNKGNTTSTKLSSRSNDCLSENHKSLKNLDLYKCSRDRSIHSESAPSDRKRINRKSREKADRPKKRGRKDDSPEPRRSRDYKRSSKAKQWRSRSRSVSPSHSSKQQYRREKSPHHSMRHNRQRSFSRSPSPPSFRRYVRRSPLRHRSRSRSPAHYRIRKSNSPGSRRRRKSRSKSKSPFINEICRLKKQWEIEDKAKEISLKYSLSSSEMHPTCMPLVAAWPDEGSASASLVSNMLSVSVEAVQVHSTSFTIGSMDGPHPIYSGGPPALVGPQIQSPFVAPLMGPGYGMCNGGNTYAMPIQYGFSAHPVEKNSRPPSLPYPQDEPVANASNEYQPSIPISLPQPQTRVEPSSPSVMQPSPNTSEPQSVLRKQLDILLSTVVTNAESLSSLGKLGGSSSSKMKQSQEKTPIPPSVRQNLIPCKLSTNEIPSSSSQATQQLSTKVISDLKSVGSDNSLLSRAGKPRSNGMQTAKKHYMHESENRVNDNPPFLASSSSEVECSSSQLEKSSSELVISETVHSTANVALERSHSTDDSREPRNSLALNTGEKLAKSPLEMPTTLDLMHQHKSENCKTEECVVVEEYDSDVIIEEPPPKPHVELICISGDETENNFHNFKEGKDKGQQHKTHMHGVESDCSERLAEPFCEKPASGESSLSELPIAEPTHAEPSKAELSCVETVRVEPQREEISCANQGHNSQLVSLHETRRKNKKRSKRKKRNRSSSSYKEKVSDRNKKSRIEEKLQDPDEISNSASEFVIKECSEMIDSLRIGRFVVIEEDKVAQPIPYVESHSNSPLIQSSSIQFSYTKCLKPKAIPATKNVSTNTPFRLCIDVCAGTDDTVVLRESMTQTDLGCAGCAEQKDLIREMQARLLSLQKERDDLLAKVPGRGRDEIAARTIPGLDLPLGDVQISEGDTAGLNSSPTQPSSSGNSTAFSPAMRVTSEKGNSFATDRTGTAFHQVQHGEPMLAYDYNHSSPVRIGFEPQTDYYLCTKRPFQ